MHFRKREINKESSDTELIDLFKDGKDLEVLAVLYNRYIHLIYGLCLKYLKNKQDSEDAAMQLFEKLSVEIHKFEIRNFKSWLHVMCRNFCLMKLRTFKSTVEFDEALSKKNHMEFQLPVHHEDEYSLETDLEALERCLEILPDEQKKCIRLFYLEEKSYKEIVRLAGYELNNVKSYIQNGKRNIKNCIKTRIEENIS